MKTTLIIARCPNLRTSTSVVLCLSWASLDSASQVLEKHEDEFFQVVDPKVKLRWLRRKKVIPDGLVTEIEASADSEKAKDLLFEHLRLNANAVTLREYCNMLSEADAFPKMQKLGQKMLHDLLPEGS